MDSWMHQTLTFPWIIIEGMYVPNYLLRTVFTGLQLQFTARQCLKVRIGHHSPTFLLHVV